MRQTATIVLLAIIACSCSPKIVERVVERTVTVHVKDSTGIKDTTILYQLPLERDQAIVHVGDTSRRETSVAMSEAWVDSTGFLHHTLENTRRPLAVQLAIPSKTIWIETESKEAETITRTVEVPAQLNAWQRFRLRAFWWLSAILLGLLLWHFRKPLMKLIVPV